MARGPKRSYTGKQKRQASKIERGYRKRGVTKGESERRAWATVNKRTGGGKKRGSGRAGARRKTKSGARRKSTVRTRSGGRKRKTGGRRKR
jgi:plasmid stabilization system protein ParE